MTCQARIITRNFIPGRCYPCKQKAVWLIGDMRLPLCDWHLRGRFTQLGIKAERIG